MAAEESVPDPVLIGNIVLGIKSLVAPRGSIRERTLRLFTRPLVRMAIRRQHARVAADVAAYPDPTVVRWRGLAERAALLPERARIVILKLDHIGDFVVGMPAIEHIRNSFPGADLTLVCASWNRGWAERTGWFQRVVPFDLFTKRSADWVGTAPEQFAGFAALGLSGFDLAIDLRHDADTRPLLGLIDARFRAGFCAPFNKGGGVLDLALPDTEHVTAQKGSGIPLHAETRLMLLAMVVARTFGPAGRHPAVRLLRSAALGPRRADARPYAILAPGAGSPIRCWPIVRLIEVARRLADVPDLDLVVTGGPSEAAAAAEIVAALPADRVRNLCAVLPLEDIPDVIQGCALYLGYDTGTTHLAAALGVPTVAILSGVPNLKVWYPLGANVTVVAGRIACSPCHFVRAAQCPYGVACLTAISVDDVWQACADVLRPKGKVAE